MDNISLLLVGLIFLSGAISLLFKRTVNSEVLAYFRVFFPSWKFFDEYRSTPVLFIRKYSAEDEDEDEDETQGWQQALIAKKRSIFSLVLNPSGNFRFACGSLMEQFCRDLSEVEEGGDYKSLTSYQVLRDLVVYESRRVGWSGVVQFKLELIHQEERAVLLRSLPIEVPSEL